jgi:hypothetical protein
MFKNVTYFYFYGGGLLITISNTIISVFNIDWNNINNIIGYIYLVIQAICTFSVSELVLKSLLVPFYTPKPIPYKKDVDNISYIINYNLKAENKKTIDECFLNMYNAFINNITMKSVAILISVTTDEELKKYELFLLKIYRKKLFNYLLNSGQHYLEKPNQSWWSTTNIYNHNNTLISICTDRCRHFILLRRNTTVLKKCGQYQDLISLSIGYNDGYTYMDKKLYGNNTRTSGPFFSPSELINIDNIFNKKYDYTLVLDCDTKVQKNSIKKMLSVAVANPEYTIFQPRIDLYSIQTLFQYFQLLWLKYSNITYARTCSFMGHSAFFGKGLIHNKSYFDQCIGTPENPVEYVPSDALSHDTFEAMCVPVLYLPNIALLETAPKSYISWNIRELRWNIGELIVAKHIFPNLLCRNKNIPKTRNIYRLSTAKAYFALSSFRVIIMRPFLLIFIILSSVIPFYYSYISFIFMILIIIFIPNIIFLKMDSAFSFAEIFILICASLIQLTPEPIIGSIRLLLSYYKLLTNNIIWIPSDHIEKFIQSKGILYSSVLYFGPFSFISIVIFYFTYTINIMFTYFIMSIICLPLYSIITNYHFNIIQYKSRLSIRKIRKLSSTNVELVTNTSSIIIKTEPIARTPIAIARTPIMGTKVKTNLGVNAQPILISGIIPISGTHIEPINITFNIKTDTNIDTDIDTTDRDTRV